MMMDDDFDFKSNMMLIRMKNYEGKGYLNYK